MIINVVMYDNLTMASILVTKQKTFGHSIKNGKNDRNYFINTIITFVYETS